MKIRASLSAASNASQSVTWAWCMASAWRRPHRSRRRRSIRRILPGSSDVGTVHQNDWCSQTCPYEADEIVFPPLLVKLDGIEELRQLLYNAMQVIICWLSVHNFECIAPRFEQHVEVIDNIHGLDYPAGRWQEPLSSVSPDSGGNRYRGTRCLVIPKLLVAAMEHVAQCCALSLADGYSTIAAYWVVFLSCRPPSGASVAAHSIMLSCRAVKVSAVDAVKIFVI